MTSMLGLNSRKDCYDTSHENMRSNREKTKRQQQQQQQPKKKHAIINLGLQMLHGFGGFGALCCFSADHGGHFVDLTLDLAKKKKTPRFNRRF